MFSGNTCSNSVEDDISDITEIVSSPEKSPFKEDIVKISSDSSSCSSRKRVCRHIKVESDDSDYLQSLEELCSKPVLPEKETNLVQESSVSDKHFIANPGKCFSNIYTAFTTVNRGLTADEILELLLNPDDYDTYAGVPQYVQEPAAFLIDSNVLKDKTKILNLMEMECGVAEISLNDTTDLRKIEKHIWLKEVLLRQIQFIRLLDLIPVTRTLQVLENLSLK